jgi:hypothetical protein
MRVEAMEMGALMKDGSSGMPVVEVSGDAAGVGS